MVRGRGFEPLKACAFSSTPQDAFSGPKRRILSVAPLLGSCPFDLTPAQIDESRVPPHQSQHGWFYSLSFVDCLIILLV